MFELFVASWKFVFHCFMSWILVFKLGRFLILYLISVTSSSSHSLLSPVLPILLRSTYKSPFATSLLLFVFTGIMGVIIFHIFFLIWGDVGFWPDVKLCFSKSSIYLQMKALGLECRLLGSLTWFTHVVSLFQLFGALWRSNTLTFLLTSWDALTRPWAWCHFVYHGLHLLYRLIFSDLSNLLDLITVWKYKEC